VFPATLGKSDDLMPHYASIVNNQLLAGIIETPNANQLNPDNPLGRKLIVGASLLAKIFGKFASKLAPTG
jgi:hypothetical protein